jgi:hypothetical protein
MGGPGVDGDDQVKLHHHGGRRGPVREAVAQVNEGHVS